MIIRRDTLRAALACAGDGTDRRHNLAQVQVRPDGTCIATDGTILVYVREKHRFEDADYPTAGPADLTELTQPVSVPIALVDRLIKGTAKKSPIPILACIRVAEDASAKPYAMSTDLQVPTVADLAKEQADHTFPAVDKCMVQADARPSIRLTLSSAKLKQLIAIAEAIKAHPKATPSITFEIPTEAKYQGTAPKGNAADADVPDGALTCAVRFTTGSGDSTAEGVVMPMRA